MIVRVATILFFLLFGFNVIWGGIPPILIGVIALIVAVAMIFAERLP